MRTDVVHQPIGDMKEGSANTGLPRPDYADATPVDHTAPP
jgi:hypothetical protein